MKLPTVARWSAGDQPDAAMFNDMSYSLNFAMSPPEAWVVRNGAGQSVTLNVFTPINFTHIIIDTGADAGDDPVWESFEPAKVYMKTPGWYDIEGNIHWASSTDNLRRIITVAHNGTHRFRNDIVSRADMKQRVSGMWFLNAGDYLELYAFSSSTTSLAADPGQNSLRAGLKLRWFSM